MSGNYTSDRELVFYNCNFPQSCLASIVKAIFTVSKCSGISSAIKPTFPFMIGTDPEYIQARNEKKIPHPLKELKCKKISINSIAINKSRF
jgi:hypothetical protein